MHVVDIIEKIGGVTLHISKAFFDTISFAVRMIFRMFDKDSYNSATRSVLTHQIYYTSVEILPLFIIVSVVLGTLIMGIVFETIKGLGLDKFMGNFLIGFAVTELSPFVTVLLLALRSGSAINTEIAVMKVNRELDALKAFHIDETLYLFLPRILNGIISLILLNGLFSIVLLASGFLFSNFIFGMGFNSYSRLLAQSVHLSDMVILTLKCITFGFFITLIPIRSGMRASYELTSIPIAALHGMLRVFLALVIIEVISLIARFA